MVDPATPDDLLILAGANMDRDDPVLLYRWRDAARHDAEGIVRPQHLDHPMRIPDGRGCDHGEGVALLPPDAVPDGFRELLVLYDSPAKRRLRGRGSRWGVLWCWGCEGERGL
jgi:hypothetical protein